MKTFSVKRAEPRLGPLDSAARKRAAVETYAQNEAVLRRLARRYSLCADDAEDALQRGLEILLRKAPTEDPRELIKWMQTVVRHEALAIRKERELTLAGPAAESSGRTSRTGSRSSPAPPPARRRRPSGARRSPAAARRCRP